MSIAIFPGSFDPPTYGHLNIVERASKLVDELRVVVSINPNKQSFFTGDERLELMKEFCSIYPNVKVDSYNGLIVNYAKEQSINIIIRGLRPLSDFAYEFEMATINYQLNNNVETLFIPTAPKYSVLRSSSLKEMMIFGGEIEALAPQKVIDMIKTKLS